MRNAGATWFIPSEDEWYKAAYYDGNANTYYDYATGTDTTPDNNPPSLDSGNSANFDNDSGFTTGDSNYPMTDGGGVHAFCRPLWHVRPGGQCVGVERGAHRRHVSGPVQGVQWADPSSYLVASFRNTNFGDPAFESGAIGFRVATVPEPSTYVLAAFGLAALSASGRWRK